MPSATAQNGSVISAQEAAQDVARYKKKMDNSRWSPPVLERTKRDIEDRVHVFSVSPWGDTVAMAEWGAFTIPPCPEDREYVEFLMHDEDGTPKAIPGIMQHRYVQDETRYAWHQEDGREWAEKLLNNDSGIHRMFSRNRVGMFVAKGDRPTKTELANAREELHGYMLDRINEAREWWSDPVQKKGITREVHWLCARILHLADEAWMVAENPQGRKKCLMCGAFSDPDVIKCGACKEFIFDHVAYKKLLSEQAAQQASA